MEFNTWIVFIGIIGLLIAFPGPSALLCLSHGVKFGKNKAIATILGGAIASVILMGLSAIGLGAILAASELAFLIIKVLGAGYLIYLGVRAFFDKNSLIDPTTSLAIKDKKSSLSLLNQGFVIGISNPKDLLFFAALFPNFINVAEPQFFQFTILASSWLVLDFIIMYVYASLGNKVSPFFASHTVIKVFNRTIGGLFVTIGGTILLGRNSG
ncbi:MAG: threonine/homoserine/homoserine lactone efflux protein [Oceanospirillaceae bacterium]|jgi:threonine/homoserine/homoserine lactone efflux protein